MKIRVKKRISGYAKIAYCTEEIDCYAYRRLPTGSKFVRVGPDGKEQIQTCYEDCLMIFRTKEAHQNKKFSVIVVRDSDDVTIL